MIFQPPPNPHNVDITRVLATRGAQWSNQIRNRLSNHKDTHPASAVFILAPSQSTDFWGVVDLRCNPHNMGIVVESRITALHWSNQI